MKLFRHPLVATLSAVMLAARLLAPDVWHDCSAMMQAEPVAQAAGMDHAGMDHAGMDHAGMAHADMAHADVAHADMAHADMAHAVVSPDDATGGDESHQCDCDTSCCCVATAATRPDPASLTLASYVEHRAPALAPRQHAVATRTDLRIPFNTPPPASRS